MASLEISLELNVICPKCDHYNDLRENDHEADYHYSNLAIERLSGKEMKIKDDFECLNCGEKIVLDDFYIN